MDLISTKICVAFVLGLWRFFCGILPVKLDRCLRKWEESSTDSKTFINKRRHQQVSCMVALTQSFGGGVLFATCFLHMIKELFVSIEEIKVKWELTTDYPLSQLIIAIGFFLIYFLEEFTHWVVNNSTRRKCNLKPKSQRLSKYGTKIGSSTSSSKSTKSLKSSKVSPIKIVATIEEWEQNNKNKKLEILEIDHDNEINYNAKVPLSKKNDEAFIRTSSARSRHSINEEIEKGNLEILQEEILSAEDEEEVKNKEQMMRCALTIAALSLHSIMEGLSIGIQRLEYEIWYLFIAISIHSASILFCLGLELVLAQTRVKYIIMQMLALSLASPLGIFLGLVVTVETSSRPSLMSVASVALEGFSAGTILYITFFEVLNREKERRVYRLTRGLCILGGFSLMALLQYYECISKNFEQVEKESERSTEIFNTTPS